MSVGQVRCIGGLLVWWVGKVSMWVVYICVPFIFANFVVEEEIENFKAT